MKDPNQTYLEALLPERKEIFRNMELFAKENRVPIMEPTGIAVMLQIMSIQKPRRILEIGTAIGYSAMRMAEALPETRIITMEMDDTRYEQAMQNVQASDYAEQISILKGDALDLAGEAEKFAPFDAIFIDAAKGQYSKFFDLYSPMLADGGIVYSDNVLYKGLVADDSAAASKRLAKIAGKIGAFNKWLMEREDFHTVILSVGDGLAISRKKSAQ
ncbi:MAG TPA: O-methyltransferase [Bacillaceae bacterium]